MATGQTGRVCHLARHPEGRRPVYLAPTRPQAQQRNLITTRIIRLRGLEAGHNSGTGCDSYERYIYIHGTNHEGRIGVPFSGGCIELRNSDMAELFDCVDEGDLIWIGD